jgi:hypothetical protein
VHVGWAAAAGRIRLTSGERRWVKGARASLGCGGPILGSGRRGAHRTTLSTATATRRVGNGGARLEERSMAREIESVRRASLGWRLWRWPTTRGFCGGGRSRRRNGVELMAASGWPAAWLVEEGTTLGARGRCLGGAWRGGAAQVGSSTQHGEESRTSKVEWGGESSGQEKENLASWVSWRQG